LTAADCGGVKQQLRKECGTIHGGGAAETAPEQSRTPGFQGQADAPEGPGPACLQRKAKRDWAPNRESAGERRNASPCIGCLWHGRRVAPGDSSHPSVSIWRCAGIAAGGARGGRVVESPPGGRETLRWNDGSHSTVRAGPRRPGFTFCSGVTSGTRWTIRCFWAGYPAYAADSLPSPGYTGLRYASAKAFSARRSPSRG
jgi:hypothetical protein